MPRFVRGGRGLMRAIKQGNGFFPSSSSSNSERKPIYHTQSYPSVCKTFKIIAIIIFSLLFIFFSLGLATEADIFLMLTVATTIVSLIFLTIVLAYNLFEPAYAYDRIQENHENSIEFLKSHKEKINDIIDSNYRFIKLFMENVGDKDNKFLLSQIVDPYPLYSILPNDTDVVKVFLEHDGITEFQTRLSAVAGNEVSVLKDELAKKISWDDADTFYSVIYYTIRNGIVRYYHDKYINLYGNCSIEEYIKSVGYSKRDTSMYTYYYIYENDISLPLMGTYDEIKNKFQKIQQLLKNKEIVEKSGFVTNNSI